MPGARTGAAYVRQLRPRPQSTVNHPSGRATCLAIVIRRANVRLEPSRERPQRHVILPGQRIEGQVAVEVLHHPCDQRGQRDDRVDRQGLLDELAVDQCLYPRTVRHALQHRPTAAQLDKHMQRVYGTQVAPRMHERLSQPRHRTELGHHVELPLGGSSTLGPTRAGAVTARPASLSNVTFLPAPAVR
jgi:hypothetical protein